MLQKRVVATDALEGFASKENAGRLSDDIAVPQTELDQ